MESRWICAVIQLFIIPAPYCGGKVGSNEQHASSVIAPWDSNSLFGFYCAFRYYGLTHHDGEAHKAWQQLALPIVWCKPVS